MITKPKKQTPRQKLVERIERRLAALEISRKNACAHRDFAAARAFQESIDTFKDLAPKWRPAGSLATHD